MNGCALIRLVSSRSTTQQKETADSSGYYLSTSLSYVTLRYVTTPTTRTDVVGSSATLLLEPCDLTFHATTKAAKTLLRTHGTSTKTYGVTAHSNDCAVARCTRSLSALLGPIMKTEPLGRFSRARGVGTKQGMHTLRPLCLFQTLRCQIGKR